MSHCGRTFWSKVTFKDFELDLYGSPMPQILVQVESSMRKQWVTIVSFA